MATREEIARGQLEVFQENIGTPLETPRDALEAWIDFYSSEIPLMAPFFQAIKEPILATYDLLENRTNEMNRLMDELMNELDNSIEPPNNSQADSDGDGIPDNLDPYPNDASPDSDGDGVPDHSDMYPNDPNNGQGHQTPYDPTQPGMSDPLVLDTDKDGFISTISLDDSSAYFDLTGDGVKEKVGWIAPNDALVAYDKNENGKIDGIDEVFGNPTTTGFEELRQIADSNYDGKIDRQDELYSRLKVWNDINQDGISQEDELVSLKDAGVKSIDLNVVGTNINVNGNLITEAGKYTDQNGNLELAADVELTFDSRITTIDTSTIPDYTEYPESSTLPFLRGYGLIMDSFISYNTNDALKEKAIELQAGGIQAIAEGFENMRHLKYKNKSWHLVQNNIEFKLKREVA
ncbi:hypothetical protein [Sulfurimonas sp.]|uniref:hypothetical protein n=1 Tax=Sulfurimonas sp. TaxID=2022749 RepID=UPI0035688C4B